MGDIRLACHDASSRTDLRGAIAWRVAMRLTRIAALVLIAVGAWAALIFALTLLVRVLR